MTTVNVTNFVRAETDRMFEALQAVSGEVNRFAHNRVPTPLDQQTVIRMNRDTLYSSAIVDLAGGATLTLPDAGDRYLSAMVVDRDHHVNLVLHDPGEHRLTEDEAGSRHALIAVRVLVDPADPGDVDAVAALQDGIGLSATSAEPFVGGDWDADSLDATRAGLLALAAGLSGFDGAFGSAHEVDPVLHLLGTAAGWGGLPSSEAVYVNLAPGLPVGAYEITVRDVPVDGFWSLSVYDADGFFEPNDLGVNSVNSVTAVAEPDGTVVVRLGDHPAGAANVIPLTEGWNYVVRLYRPHPEVLDRSWTFPAIS